MSLISNLIFCFRQKIHLQCIPTTFISFCNSLTEPLKCKKNSSDKKSNQIDDECNRNSVFEAVLPKPGKQSYDQNFSISDCTEEYKFSFCNLFHKSNFGYDPVNQSGQVGKD